MSDQCQWAGCTRTDARHVDGYWHCPPHLEEHYDLTYGRAKHLSLDERLAQIRPLHAQGLDDAAVAERIGLSVGQTKRLRQIGGMASNYRRSLHDKPINHGTTYGYRAHRDRGENPCDECRRVRREYDAKQHQELLRRRREGAA